jgi:hypothetical protein
MSRLGRWAHFSVRVVATADMEKLMNCPTAEKLFFVEPGTAEEICKVLEETILKYFPPQIENVDPSIFADGAQQSRCSPLGLLFLAVAT